MEKTMKLYYHPTIPFYACDDEGNAWSFYKKGGRGSLDNKPRLVYKNLVTVGTKHKRQQYHITLVKDKKVITKTLHRFVFECYYGYSPKEVDHKDRNCLNNNPTNLREATRSQNEHNIIKSNKTGFRGVTKFQQGNCIRYYAKIKNNGKREHLGCFKTPEEAHQAYCQRAKEIYKEFCLTTN